MKSYQKYTYYKKNTFYQITKKVQNFNLLIAIVSTEAEAINITLQLNNEGI
ncbi:MAG: hypothetical protein ACOVNU_03125 [Candidatus Kapaibacteriota bacterium]|jgi:hypothetical protein